MHHAIEVVPFGDFSGPCLAARFANSAEKAGWEGLFLWDHLSQDRVVFGAGLGRAANESSKFGEPAETNRRGALRDEGLKVLDQLLRGETITHQGQFYSAQGVSLKPLTGAYIAPTDLDWRRKPSCATPGCQVGWLGYPWQRFGREDGSCPGCVISKGRLYVLVQVSKRSDRNCR